MVAMNAFEGYLCGFGGCSAPVAPIPMSFGFGGCSAPVAPVPVLLPSANSSFGTGQVPGRVIDVDAPAPANNNRAWQR